MDLRSSFYAVVVLSLVLWSTGILIRTYRLSIKPVVVSRLIDHRVTTESTDFTRVTLTTRAQDVEESERERCEQLRDIKDEQVFQHLDDKNNCYVYSALWDSVDKRKQKLRIVGIIQVPKQTCSTWYCYIRDKLSKRCIVIEAHAPERVFFHHGWVSARFFNCPLPPGIVPEGVSLTMTPNGLLYNRIPIITDESKQRLQFNFTMCVSPIHSGYNNTSQLITFIELSTILGADYFVFYNNSMANSVEQILLNMVEEGLALVIQWQVPEGGPMGYAYYSQVAMLNDCMNRMIYRTRFVCETDLDEFIIPRKYQTWQDVITDKQEVFPGAGAFLVQAEYYLGENANRSFKYPGKDVAEMYDVKPLLNMVKRTGLPDGLRLWKYIYDPRKVEVLLVHKPAELRPPWHAVKFENDEAVFHHYQNSFKHEENFFGAPQTLETDTIMFRFKDELLSRIEARVKKYKKT